MNKIKTGLAVLGVVGLIGTGIKKLSDSVKNNLEHPIDISQTIEEIKTPENLSNQTITGTFIDKNGINSWLLDNGIDQSPKFNSIFICSGYGCLYKQKFKITELMYNDYKSILEKSINAEEERENLTKVIDLFKINYSQELKINDKPGEQFLSNSKPSQMSSLDETTNTTQFLYLLAENGYIKFHHINSPSTNKSWFGVVTTITEAATKKPYDVMYDKNGKSVILLR